MTNGKKEVKEVSTELEEKVTSSLVDGQLPCSIAFEVAQELEVSQREIGKTADELGIKITECQLGCFESEKATYSDVGSIDINNTLAEEVKAVLVSGYLPCAVTFQVAKKLKVAPKEVGNAANKLKIKITGCQLGCFP